MWLHVPSSVCPSVPVPEDWTSVLKSQSPDTVLYVSSNGTSTPPRDIKLHLFGVKGSAIAELDGHPRIASTDSQAWDRAARWEASKARTSCTMAHRERHLRSWHAAQCGHLANPQLRMAI